LNFSSLPAYDLYVTIENLELLPAIPEHISTGKLYSLLRHLYDDIKFQWSGVIRRVQIALKPDKPYIRSACNVPAVGLLLNRRYFYNPKMSNKA